MKKEIKYIRDTNLFFLYSLLLFLFLQIVLRSLVFGFGNIINAAPVVAVIFYSILFAWLSAANKLSTLFVAQTEMNKAEKAKKE
jgi:ATP/ADP translocase